MLSSCKLHIDIITEPFDVSITGEHLYGVGTYPINETLDIGLTYYEDGKVAKSYGKTKITEVIINGNIHTFYSYEDKVLKIDIGNYKLLYSNKELELARFSFRDLIKDLDID